MNPILRNILAILAGFIASSIVMLGLEMSLPSIFNTPPPPTEGGAGAMSDFINGVPLGAKLSLVLIYALSSFLAGYITTWLASKPAAVWPVAVLALLFGAGGISNFMHIQHQALLVVACMAALLAGPFCGYLARR